LFCAFKTKLQLLTFSTINAAGEMKEESADNEMWCYLQKYIATNKTETIFFLVITQFRNLQKNSAENGIDYFFIY